MNYDGTFNVIVHDACRKHSFWTVLSYSEVLWLLCLIF